MDEQEELKAQLIEALEDIAGHLNNAMDQITYTKRIARSIGGEVERVVTGPLELHLEKHLHSFLQNPQQPGSIPGLIRALGEEDLC